MIGPATAQQNFAAGMARVAPHLMPQNAAWRLPNMLLDDDGSAYKRGGTEALSNAPFGTGLRFLWEGELAGGLRTVFASPTALGVLQADGVTPLSLGAGGMAAPLRPASIDGILFVGNYAYGGARIVGNYAAGTIDVVAGSTMVFGHGTVWGGHLEAGSLLTIGDSLVAVATVADDTHLELIEPWGGATQAGIAYSGDAVALIPAAYHPAGIYGVAGNRLLSAVGNRIYESKGGDSSIHDATEYHELPAGEQVLAIEGLGSVAYVFTTGGIWEITNVAYDLTDDLGDAQQALQRVSGDIILWNATGLGFWEDSLVVPAQDGVWHFGPGGMQLLSRLISPLYTSYVRSGYRPGLAATYQGHYFLPVLAGDGSVVTMLVCRLDRPIDAWGSGVRSPRRHTRYMFDFGWVDWSGSGAQVAALASRRVGIPRLLGAEQGLGAKVLKMPPLLPDGLAVDHDGSTFEWGVVSRDYATGPLNTNLVKKVQARYELISRDNTATIIGSYGTDARPSLATWGSAKWGADLWTDADDAGFTVLGGAAPESLGDVPWRWRINKKTRYIRFRLLSRDAATRAVLRSIEVFVRPSGRMYG